VRFCFDLSRPVETRFRLGRAPSGDHEPQLVFMRSTEVLIAWIWLTSAFTGCPVIWPCCNVRSCRFAINASDALYAAVKSGPGIYAFACFAGGPVASEDASAVVTVSCVVLDWSSAPLLFQPAYADSTVLVRASNADAVGLNGAAASAAVFAASAAWPGGL